MPHEEHFLERSGRLGCGTRERGPRGPHRLRHGGAVVTALEGDVEGLVFEPAPRAEWEELAAVDSSATLLQTPRWSDCVCADGTFRDASLLFRFAGGHRMVLPLARPARRPSQLSPLGSWPFDWGIGGPVSDRATTPDEVAGVARVLRGLRAPGITVRI